MTRKKAIEAAADRFDRDQLECMDRFPSRDRFNAVVRSADKVASYAYDLGRIAGLREAARMMVGYSAARINDQADKLEGRRSK